MALLIKSDGSTQHVNPENGTDFELRQLHRLLECDMIEVIYLPKSREIMVIDEEGKFKSPCILNLLATALAVEKGFEFIPSDPGIVGHALICKDEELK